MNVTTAECQQIDCTGIMCLQTATHVATTPCCKRIVTACRRHVKIIESDRSVKSNWFGFLSNPCARCGDHRPHEVKCQACGEPWPKSRALTWLRP